MQYINIPFKITGSILFFLLYQLLILLKVRKEYHAVKWIWLDYSFFPVDKTLVKYILKLNKMGHKTSFCCQGYIEKIKSQSFLHSPYICADSFPSLLLEKCKSKNFEIKKSNLGISIYFMNDSKPIKEIDEKILLNFILLTLEEWYIEEEK